MRNGEDEVIWITPVVPEPDLSRLVFAESVAENVQSYWRCNGLRTCSSQRPYLADPQETDPVMTWTEKTTLHSMSFNGLRYGDEGLTRIAVESLPGVLNRTEVAKIGYEQISPIDNAIAEVTRATRVLRSLSQSRAGQAVE